MIEVNKVTFGYKVGGFRIDIPKLGVEPGNTTWRYQTIRNLRSLLSREKRKNPIIGQWPQRRSTIEKKYAPIEMGYNYKRDCSPEA